MRPALLLLVPIVQALDPEPYVLADPDIWCAALAGPVPDWRPPDPPTPIVVGGWRGSPARVVIAHWAVGLPHLTRELSSWTFTDVHVPVFNASTVPLDYLHVHYGDAVPNQDGLHPQITEWSDGGRIVPLGLSVRLTFLNAVDLDGLEVATAREPVSARAVAPHARALAYGTLGTEDETRALIAGARSDQQRIWYATGHAPEVLSDRAFNENPRVPVR